MRKTYGTPSFYLILALILQAGALANLFNDHVLYAAALSCAGAWLMILAAAAFWYARAPHDVSAGLRLVLGAVTIVIGSGVALGIVGFEQQLNSPFLPFYVSMVVYCIYRRHRAGYPAWQAV